MKEKLVMLGGGGHCHSVLDTVKRLGKYKDIVITDPDLPVGTEIQGCEVVGTDDNLPDLYQCGYQDAMISIGSMKDSSIRRKLYDKARENGFSFPSAIDPSSAVTLDAEIEEGIFVGKNAVINSGSKIHRFAILNTGSIVEHDCEIGEFTHLAVGAVICGGCKVENDVFVGANATVIQGVHIGRESVIGAGSLVLADVPEGTMVTGVWK